MNYLSAFKGNFMKNRKKALISFVAVAFFAMLLTIVFSMTKEVEATQLQTSDTTFNIYNSTSGGSGPFEIQYMVSDGQTYTISGLDAADTRVDFSNIYFDIVPTSTARNVTIVLDNVSIKNSSVDKPAIKLNAISAEHKINYTIVVKGNCYLENSMQGSKSAVIEAQSLDASVVRLKNSSKIAEQTKLSDLLEDGNERYESTLVITSANTGINDERDVLTVVSAPDGYGAGIGTSETSTYIPNIVLSAGKSEKFKPYYCLDENGNNIGQHSAYDYLAEKYSSFDRNREYSKGQEFLVDSVPRASAVTVDGILELIVNSKGYGAGIGGGGSTSSTTLPGKGGLFILNQGTVVMDSYVSNVPAIGSGRTSGGTKNISDAVVINGGSLAIKAQTKFDTAPVNSAGQKLYLWEVDLNDITGVSGRGFSVGEDKNGSLPLSNPEYDTEYTVDYDIKASGYGELSIGNISYDYKGFGNANYNHSISFPGDIKNVLSFYLPTTLRAQMNIDPSSVIVRGQRIEVYQNDVKRSPSDANGFQYLLGAGSMIDIRVYDIPEGLEVSNINVASSIYPVALVNDDPDNPYYIVSFRMPDNTVTVKVNYGGQIPIEYNNGFLSSDTTNHRYVAPSANSFSYGTPLVLQAPLADDLVFEGWYLTGTDTKVTTIQSSDIVSGDIVKNGKISLTARWSCEVTYLYNIPEINGSEDAIIGTSKIPYGTTFVHDPASPAYDAPSFQYYDFIGWTVEGEGDAVYTVSNGFKYTVSQMVTSVTIRGNYKKNRFYIYLDKKFFAGTNVSVMMGSRNVSVDTAVEYSENGKIYYRGLITEAVEAVTLNIEAKHGYEISKNNWSVTIINATSSTDSWNDNAVAYSIGLGEKDIYVNNNITGFTPKEYTIQFYDGVNMNTPYKEVTYDIETLPLPSTLTSILGADYIGINNRYDRYHKFIGYKDILHNGEKDPFVTTVNELGNYIFIANWEEVDTYALDITVYNGKDNTVSDEVAAIPYLYDEEYDSKSTIDYETIHDPVTGQDKKYAYVIPGDSVYFEFVALGEDGEFYKDEQGNYRIVELGEGIDLSAPEAGAFDYRIKYDYESKDEEITTKKIRDNKQYISIPSDVKDDTIIEVSIRIDFAEFTIQYWDLRGYANTQNPLKYTIFDEFEFKDIVDGVHWLVVVQDNDDTNYDEVTTRRIDGVSKWSSGNLVLKPDWQGGDDRYYNISVDVDDTAKGTITIVNPTVDMEYKAASNIIIRVEFVKGYKLQENSLTYQKVDNTPVSRSMFQRSSNLLGDGFQTNVIITPISVEEGIYLFSMPSSDIVLTAQFVPEVYNIYYNDVSGLENENPLTYTVEDEIVLSELEKEGYKFEGWVDEHGNIISVISGRVGDIELHPSWTAKEEATTTQSKNPNHETTKPSKETTKPSKETTKPSKETASKDGNGEDSRDDVEETTTKNQFIGGNGSNGNGSNGNSSNGNGYPTRTGDDTNVMRLIMICVVATIALVILVVKKKDNSEEDEGEI